MYDIGCGAIKESGLGLFAIKDCKRRSCLIGTVSGPCRLKLTSFID